VVCRPSYSNTPILNSTTFNLDRKTSKVTYYHFRCFMEGIINITVKHTVEATITAEVKVYRVQVG
jgi:hypothetical protein